MVTESKYTSPCPSMVAHTLAAKAAAMASAIGTSMPARPLEISRQAPAKNERAENITTGAVRAMLAHCINAAHCASMSPASARYTGTAYIITCIMPSPATASSNKRRRFSLVRSAVRWAASNGRAWSPTSATVRKIVESFRSAARQPMRARWVE